MLATFLTLQSGTLFIYQGKLKFHEQRICKLNTLKGQELGMINVEKSRQISDYRDLETLNAWKE